MSEPEDIINSHEDGDNGQQINDGPRGPTATEASITPTPFSTTSYMPRTQQIEGLLANTISSSQTGGNRALEHIGVSNISNGMHAYQSNMDAYQPDQIMTHLPNPSMNVYPYQPSQSMYANQQPNQNSNAHQPSQCMNTYQHETEAPTIPQCQGQYNSTNSDLALSQYGYGQQSSMSSPSIHTELNPTVPIGCSQASAMPYQANNFFAQGQSTLPYQSNMLARQSQQNINDYSQATNQDWTPMHHPTSLHNFGAHTNAPMPAFNVNSLAQFPEASPSSAGLKLPSTSSILPLQSPITFSSPQPQPRGSTSSPLVLSLPQHNALHATSLAVSSDCTFLDPLHIFLRSTCIELFMTTQDHMTCAGRGARASKVGQVGLICVYCKGVPQQELTRQAICYPSKRDTIFESVRNYQRVHLKECPRIPDEIKARYQSLIDAADSPNKKPQKILKAYYTEAATELGIVDSPKGLIFGAPLNTSGTPLEDLQAVIRAAESPAMSTDFWKKYNASYNEKNTELRKFDHLASEQTREVLRNARKEESRFVHPQDFPTVSDVDFLLYKQVLPCKPSANTLKRREVKHEEFKGLSGICCKHCARAHVGEGYHSGMYFPMSLSALTDSSFSQSLLNHMMACRNVPQDVKDAFDELKRLASEHGVATKRGSKKKFLEKIWGRMEHFYA
mmetsp:Transcript_19123/g.45932  ORF Transcript_19123/g.45932 Transcript_19123/m.45932 type:complete len:674 (+) Transcript_19123:119-2140(+)